MMRRLYSALTWAAQPLLRRKLLRRAQAEPRYGQAMEQRFGDYRAVPFVPGGLVVWVHAVSLGETRAAALLVQALRRAYPQMRLVLTHGTATGWEQGQGLLQAGDAQAWLPWDVPAAVRGFIQHFRPGVGLLMETEVWPNLVAACARHGVPLCLVNARLSARSLRQAQRLRWLAQPAYRALHGAWAQTDDDARRLRALGAAVRGVTGNLKFDAEPDAALWERGRAWRAASARPVVLLAASREGEEQMLLDALRGLGDAARAQVQWLLVPRHPQRFDAVAALVQDQGWQLSRRSRWGETPSAADVWLGDSLGEMAQYYGMADVALLGGSFAPLGGQNLIEAAACGCPLVLGPHTFNFLEAAQHAVTAGAACRVPDMAAAVARALQWLSQPAQRAEAARRGLDWSRSHRGATERTVRGLAHLLSSAAAR